MQLIRLSVGPAVYDLSHTLQPQGGVYSRHRANICSLPLLLAAVLAAPGGLAAQGEAVPDADPAIAAGVRGRLSYVSVPKLTPPLSLRRTLPLILDSSEFEMPAAAVANAPAGSAPLVPPRSERDDDPIYTLARRSDVILTGLFFLPLALVEPLEGFDQDISNRFHTPGRNAVARKIGRSFGTFGIDMGLATATFGLGKLTGGSGLARVGLHTGETLLVSEYLADVFKYAIGRARPSEGLGPDHFVVFKFRSENNSYPSGHAVHAFAIATTVSRELHDQAPWVPFIAFPLATWTATTRVLDQRHFPTDVFAGAMLGILSSNVVARFNHRRNSGERRVSVGLYAPEGGGTGLAVSIPTR